MHNKDFDPIEQPQFISVHFAIDNNGNSYCSWDVLHPYLKQFVTEEMREHIVCNCSANCGQIYEVVTMANIMKAVEAMKADKIRRLN